ncbi:hypothetical protein MATL_G00236380 [Megalops atlanticus]|uniref:Protein FAM167A n=1 Tax=Megalops atlanticus TaxID=7932 RepID=A0A9D3PG47_MEGAT|nr:hypothetical protein MATL_G00236380 [Megalops atlanticus]
MRGEDPGHCQLPSERSMNPETQCEDTVSAMVLENIKNKLIHAFRVTGEPLTAAGSGADSVNSIGRNYQANEELRRAKIDGAITWLRTELLEMRSQDRQLAETLLGLNSEIQKLRRESSGVTLDPAGAGQD